MKKLQIFLTVCLGLLNTLFLVGVIYLTFIFPKTIQIWEEEGRAITAFQENLVEMSNQCQNYALAIIPILLIADMLCVVYGTLAVKRNHETIGEESDNYRSQPEKEKKEILEMLAKKEISKEEAETKLQEIKTDIPEAQPAPPSKNNLGCLIVLILGALLLPLLVVIAIIS